MMASSATSQNWEKKPLPYCLLHVLVTSKAVIGEVFYFFEICKVPSGLVIIHKRNLPILATCLTMSERKVEKFRNHAIFWLHVTTYCLNMATSICFPHNVIDNGPIFTKEKPLHVCCTSILLLSLGCKISPKI